MRKYHKLSPLTTSLPDAVTGLFEDDESQWRMLNGVFVHKACRIPTTCTVQTKTTDAVIAKDVVFGPFAACTIYVCHSGFVMCGGEFHAGTFRGGSFHGGEFRGGDFRDGYFAGGTYRGGNFHGGYYRDGTYLGGDFLQGTFNAGIFHRGVFKSGTFNWATYYDGYYEAGIYGGFCDTYCETLLQGRIGMYAYVLHPNGILSIGCQAHTLAHWRGHYQEIADEQDLGKRERAALKIFVDSMYELYKLRKRPSRKSQAAVATPTTAKS